MKPHDKLGRWHIHCSSCDREFVGQVELGPVIVPNSHESGFNCCPFCGANFEDGDRQKIKRKPIARIEFGGVSGKIKN